jgi:hypothetical protein
MREQSVIHAEALLRAIPRVSKGVQDALDARDRLVASLREAQEEQAKAVPVAATPDDWRTWREALAGADMAAASLAGVIAAMAEMETPADLAVVHAIVESGPEIHGILVAELASLLADAGEAARAFRGAPIPGGDAVPHLSAAKQAAWGVLDRAVGRYGAVRGGEFHLRKLIGGGEPDMALAEFRDVAHPLLWGGLDQWRSRKFTGHRPGPSSDRPIDRIAWLATLPEGLVWLPTAAEERVAFDAWRIKTTSKASALGAYVPQG